MKKIRLSPFWPIINLDTPYMYCLVKLNIDLQNTKIERLYLFSRYFSRQLE